MPRSPLFKSTTATTTLRSRKRGTRAGGMATWWLTTFGISNFALRHNTKSLTKEICKHRVNFCIKLLITVFGRFTKCMLIVAVLCYDVTLFSIIEIWFYCLILPNFLNFAWFSPERRIACRKFLAMKTALFHDIASKMYNTEWTCLKKQTKLLHTEKNNVDVCVIVRFF